MIDGGVVSWSTKKQDIISLSTTEAEYIAATHAVKEALWLRTFISQVFGGKVDEPTTLYSDNQSAIALAKDHQYHARINTLTFIFTSSMDCGQRKNQAGILPHERHACGHFYKGFTKHKRQAFCSSIRSCSDLRGVLELVQF